MKNLMTSVKNALGIRAEATASGGGCGNSERWPMWRWYLYHSM